MHLVFITPEFPPPVRGGGGIYAYNLVKQLSAFSNVRISVIVQDEIFPKQRKLEISSPFKNVTMFRYPATRFQAINYSFISIKGFLHILKLNCDLIHVSGYPLFGGEIASIISRWKKIPMILTIHGFPRTKSILQRVYHAFYHNTNGKLMIDQASMIISVSKSLAVDFSSRVEWGKMKIIPNGIEISSPDPTFFQKTRQKHPKTIVSIGRIDEQKGFRYLIESMVYLVKKYPDVKLIIAGKDYGEKANLLSIIQKNNLYKCVDLLGFISEKKKEELLAMADVFVVPSVYEPFGIVVLEGMNAGVPVVASNVGGIRSIIKTGYNGLLVPPRDVKQLVDAISMIFDDPSRARSFSLNAHATLKQFTWASVAERTMSLYQHVLKKE